LAPIQADVPWTAAGRGRSHSKHQWPAPWRGGPAAQELCSGRPPVGAPVRARSSV